MKDYKEYLKQKLYEEHENSMNTAKALHDSIIKNIAAAHANTFHSREFEIQHDAIVSYLQDSAAAAGVLFAQPSDALPHMTEENGGSNPFRNTPHVRDAAIARIANDRDKAKHSPGFEPERGGDGYENSDPGSEGDHEDNPEFPGIFENEITRHAQNVVDDASSYDEESN